MAGREVVALGEPHADLRRFPTADLGGDWFRAHTVGNGPWWFAHTGQGRFDLPAPEGTCYLASHAVAALYERLGERLTRLGMISGTEADRIVVSRLTVSEVVADATAQRATRFGITRELGTVVPYDLPRRWARALREAGHDGLRYWPRFSVSPAFRALALFGHAGEHLSRPIDPDPRPGRAAAAAAGVRVVDRPRSLPISSPPARA